MPNPEYKEFAKDVKNINQNKNGTKGEQAEWSRETQNKLKDDISVKYTEERNALAADMPVRVVKRGDTLGAIALGLRKGAYLNATGNIFQLPVEYKGKNVPLKQFNQLKLGQTVTIVVNEDGKDFIRVRDAGEIDVKPLGGAPVADAEAPAGGGKAPVSEAGPEVEEPVASDDGKPEPELPAAEAPKVQELARVAVTLINGLQNYDKALAAGGAPDANAVRQFIGINVLLKAHVEALSPAARPFFENTTTAVPTGGEATLQTQLQYVDKRLQELEQK